MSVYIFMKFGHKSLGKSLLIALMVVLLASGGIVVVTQIGNNQDIRGRAAYANCVSSLCSPSGNPCCSGSCVLIGHTYNCSTSTPATIPIPKIQTPQITSGTCQQKCLSIQGSCLGVGYDIDGTNNQIMSYGNYTSCATRQGTCKSTINRIPSGGVKCSGTLPEWTYCRCQKNPFAG